MDNTPSLEKGEKESTSVRESLDRFYNDPDIIPQIEELSFIGFEIRETVIKDIVKHTATHYPDLMPGVKEWRDKYFYDLADIAVNKMFNKLSNPNCHFENEISELLVRHMFQKNNPEFIDTISNNYPSAVITTISGDEILANPFFLFMLDIRNLLRNPVDRHGNVTMEELRASFTRLNSIDFMFEMIPSDNILPFIREFGGVTAIGSTIRIYRNSFGDVYNKQSLLEFIENMHNLLLSQRNFERMHVVSTSNQGKIYAKTICIAIAHSSNILRAFATKLYLYQMGMNNKLTDVSVRNTEEQIKDFISNL